MRDVVIIKVEKYVAAVKFRDGDGMWQGRIVPTTAVQDMYGSAKVSQDALDSGTEYGYDWDVAFPEPIVLSAKMVQQSLREHGIWIVEDLLAMPHEGVAAFLALARTMYTNWIRKARESIVN